MLVLASARPMIPFQPKLSGFAAAMRRYFESELEQSLAITPQLHKKRATWLNRARWALSFFLVTSLDYGVTRRLNFGLTAE